VVDPSLLGVLPEEVGDTLSGSAKDWQISRESFALDLRVILKYVSQHRASKENLLAASISSLWFLSNCLRSKMENEEMLWSSFLHILDDLTRDYLNGESFKPMMEAVYSFIEKQREIHLSLSENILEEGNWDTLIEYCKSLATDLDEDFYATLEKFEAAKSPNGEEDHCSDYTRSLEYLRGTVFIDVDMTMTSDDIKEKFDQVNDINSLKQKIGPIQRQKIFSMNNQGLPRFLLKFHVERGSRLMCEVQIRFRLHGLEPEFEDLANMICSLNKSRKNDTNLKKQQVLDLSREILAKTGIHLSEIFCTHWFADGNTVEIKYEEDILRIILTKNRVTFQEITEERKYQVTYVSEKHGDPLKVAGQDEKRQFQLSFLS
jgi:hypothetical protein